MVWHESEIGADVIKEGGEIEDGVEENGVCHQTAQRE